MPIERAAEEFLSQWNNHGLSTQGGQTPLQLWQRGVFNRAGAGVMQGILVGNDTLEMSEDTPLGLETANNAVSLNDLFVG